MNLDAIAKDFYDSIKNFVSKAVEQLTNDVKDIQTNITTLEESVKNISLQKGDKGDPGEKGLDGVNGVDGLPGEKGEKGEDGHRGETGEKGDQGEPGIDGKDGKDGVDGKDGKDGIDGINGDKGLDGKDGKDGVDGKDGIDGINGEKGADGQNGLDGINGKDGLDGERGERGEKGLDGTNGIDGRDGIDGKSVTVEEVLPILEEVIAKHVSEIPVVVQNGKDGIDGRDGVDGKDGMPGEKGIDGTNGRDGIDGKDGERGADGQKGADGLDGRDALQLELVDLVNPEKSYPRNTYACYQGGIIRSFKVTTPLSEVDEIEKAGWHIAIMGIASIDIESISEKEYAIAIKTTDNKVVRKEMSFPVMTYKGVWKEGEFTRNETVTWEGSLWVCATDKTTTKPKSDNSDWKLAVKKGRDGHDGLKGERGERGVEGRAGRDLTQMSFDGSKH